jgi:phosphatidate phosphatase APP1
VALFPAVGTTTHATVSGRVFKSVPHEGSTVLSTNLRRLTTGGWPGATVEVRFEGLSTTVTADHDGDFSATFSGKFAPGLLNVEAKAPQCRVGKAAVQVLADDAPFLLVSDFDDTLAITNVLSKRGVLRSSLLESDATQPVVEGMSDLYRCLRAATAQAPGFALVSGSPVQYGGRIAGFLVRHHFPFFGLYLRELSPSTLSGYKQPVIRALLTALPHPAVFVGDSGEHDPEVYRELSAQFPGRVKAIYIRDAGNAAATPAQRYEGMVLFTEPAQAARDAVAKGLADAACVEAAFPPSGSEKAMVP